MTDEEIICTVREAGMSDKELFHMAEQSGLMRFIVPEEYLMMYAKCAPFASLRAFAEMVAARASAEAEGEDDE